MHAHISCALVRHTRGIPSRTSVTNPNTFHTSEVGGGSPGENPSHVRYCAATLHVRTASSSGIYTPFSSIRQSGALVDVIRGLLGGEMRVGGAVVVRRQKVGVVFSRGLDHLGEALDAVWAQRRRAGALVAVARLSAALRRVGRERPAAKRATQSRQKSVELCCGSCYRPAERADTPVSSPGLKGAVRASFRFPSPPSQRLLS
jgi:hypothetical protein